MVVPRPHGGRAARHQPPSRRRVAVAARGAPHVHVVGAALLGKGLSGRARQDGARLLRRAQTHSRGPRSGRQILGAIRVERQARAAGPDPQAQGLRQDHRETPAQNARTGTRQLLPDRRRGSIARGGTIRACGRYQYDCGLRIDGVHGHRVVRRSRAGRYDGLRGAAHRRHRNKIRQRQRNPPARQDHNSRIL